MRLTAISQQTAGHGEWPLGHDRRPERDDFGGLLRRFAHLLGLAQRGDRHDPPSTPRPLVNVGGGQSARDSRRFG